MSRKITATIHLAALQHNLAQIKGHLQSATKIVAVIKADGYGHGLLRVARALYKADMFAVGCLDEAAELRSNAIDKPTLLLEGFEGESELRAISDLKLDTVIHSEEQWGLLQSIVLQKKISIWLKVDTGMSRLGFSPTRAEQILPVLESHPSIDRVVLISHFANANDPTHSLNGEQQQRFEQCCHTIPERSLANSAATILNNSAHYQFVRPGIALYGSSPLLNQGEAGYDLRPAMTLQAPLIAVKKIAQGESVGYGSNWQAPEGAFEKRVKSA